MEDHQLYEICKCALISIEVRNNLIENGLLYEVLDHIELFEENENKKHI